MHVMIGNPAITVAAVFATMDRSATAIACVSSLASQTRAPDWVVIADNTSKDGTIEALNALRQLPFKLIALPMDQNEGNAGGVQKAMDYAFALGADAVWILDDDSWPRPEALAALLAMPWDPRVVRHALQVDPKTGRFTWPLMVADGKNGKWRMTWAEDELPRSASVRSRTSWTGALVSKEVRDVVGPVNGALFIRGEDEEYPWRIQKAGFTQEAIRGAVMDHPGPKNVTHWKLLGKNFFFERDLADWKLYYKVRNMVWLKRKQSGSMHAISIAFSYAIAAILLDGPKRLPLVLKAARSGWRGRLGRI